MKINKKVLGLILGGIVSVSLVGCSNNTTTDTSTQVEQQEEVNQDKTIEEQISIATNYLYKCGRNGFGDDCTVITRDNTVVLIVQMNEEVAEEGLTNTSDWNKLKVQFEDTSKTFSDHVRDSGCDDIQVAVVAGDMSGDRYYLAALDGEIVYDAVEEYNTNLYN